MLILNHTVQFPHAGFAHAEHSCFGPGDLAHSVSLLFLYILIICLLIDLCCF